MKLLAQAQGPPVFSVHPTSPFSAPRFALEKLAPAACNLVTEAIWVS